MWRTALVSLILAITWLKAGRRMTLLVDGVITVRKTDLRASQFQYDGGGLRIAAVPMTLGGTNNLRADVEVTSDASGRAYLVSSGVSFPLGIRTNAPDVRGHVDIDFVPDPDDEVDFTSSSSPLSWPTPFEISFLGGATPCWRRYVYYRLLWKKPDGATLEMFWRYEQQYYSAKGWSEPAMMWDSQTGLLQIRIHPGGSSSD